MKYIGVILTVIAVLLVGVCLHLRELGAVLKQRDETSQLLIKASQSVISSNQHLAEEINNLRQQIIDLQEKVLKK